MSHVFRRHLDFTHRRSEMRGFMREFYIDEDGSPESRERQQRPRAFSAYNRDAILEFLCDDLRMVVENALTDE